MKNSEQTSREQQDIEVLKRVLLWLGAAVILETIVLLVNRFYFHLRTNEMGALPTIDTILRVIPYVAVILCLALFLWAVIAKRKNPHCGISRLIGSALCAAIAVSTFLFRYVGPATVQILQVLVPALAVLMLVYYLYQHEFFAISFLSGMAILGLWIFRSGSAKYQPFFYAYLAATLVIVLAVLVFSLVLKKNHGILHFRGKEIAVFGSKANYSVLFLTCALTAAVSLAVLAFGTTFAYYAIFAIVVWLFVMAVYFTVRLM
ncbi:MAG: hypothetical protein RR053_01980 [Evtepia sp.]